MKPKFEFHDRVRHTDSGLVGMVISIDADHKGYYVCYDDDYDEYYVDETDLEFENPKLTFLTRLQELLATFDAKIYAWGDEIYTTITLKIGDRQELYYSHGFLETHKNNLPITADNVFDYEKD